MKAFGFSFLIFFYSSASLWAAAKPEATQIAELLAMAKAGQVNWREAEFSREKANLNLLGSRSGFLPDLGLRSSYSYDWQRNQVASDSFGSEAALVSNWSLYDNGTAFRNFRLRRLELSKAELHELAVQNTVSYEIFERYLKHFMARRQKDVAEGRLKLLGGQHRLTERQYRQGLKTRRDYQRLVSETERAGLTLLRQVDAVQDSFDELKRHLGSGAVKLPEIVYPEAAVSVFLDRLKVRADLNDLSLRKMVSIRLAEVEKEIKRIQAVEAGAPLWPVLNLSAQLGYGSDQFAGRGEHWTDQERFFGQGLLQLSWNFWDWGSRRSVARSAQLDQKFAQLKAEQAELDAAAEFDRFRRENSRLKKSLSVVRRVHEIEQRTFRDIEKEYRDGQASYLDLITSLDRKSQAELDMEQETISLLLNMSQILRMTGDLYEAFNRRL